MILFEKKCQTFDTVFHHQTKYLEVRQKYSAARRIFNSLLGVSSGDETLHLMFDIVLLVRLTQPLSFCVLLKTFAPLVQGSVRKCHLHQKFADHTRSEVYRRFSKHKRM